MDKRKVTQLKRIAARQDFKSAQAIKQIINDIGKAGMPINRKYRNVRDMYKLEDII